MAILRIQNLERRKQIFNPRTNGMTYDERKLYVLTQMSNWVSFYYEGTTESHPLSDNVFEDLQSGIIKSEKDAVLIQKIFEKENKKITKQRLKLLFKINPNYNPKEQYDKLMDSLKNFNQQPNN